MCVFFIFFTPTVPPLYSVKPPQKKYPILKIHMCILSLINKIPAIFAQILFILCNSHKIHRIFIYTPQIPPTTASTSGLEIYFLGVGDLGMVGGIGIFVVIFYSKSVIRIDGRFGVYW